MMNGIPAAAIPSLHPIQDRVLNPRSVQSEKRSPTFGNQSGSATFLFRSMGATSDCTAVEIREIGCCIFRLSVLNWNSELMNLRAGFLAFFLALGVAPSTLAKLTPEQVRNLPPPASTPVDFVRDIQPILEASCTKCHGRGKAKGDLRIDTRADLLKGGETGPAAIPGKSAESYLIEVVSGLNPDNVMPQKGSRLKPEQVGLLRAWVDQGLPWPESVSFAKPEPVNLKPRHVNLPPGRKGSENPVDTFLQPYFAARSIAPVKPVNDRLFARRAYLDVVGLLPTPEELDKFSADKRADKRERLVRTLLDDRKGYAEHWLSFWNDLLRNDYKGTGYIDGGRKQISKWLYSALASNMPYDQFVAELVHPRADSEGFSKGIVWRGVVNASQTPQMQAAQNISQVFMGVNLKCASCHDSFINDWSLADAYGLAGIYASEPLEMVQCDKPTGKRASLKFLYPELGSLNANAPQDERTRRLAEIITGKGNGRLSRTIVNRLWARFFGRGLVEPVDDMEKRAWNSDLLDWLAEDLVSHAYDLKHTIERILTSQAYQMPSVPLAEQSSREFTFRGPFVRRMTAEQFRDALQSLTGSGYVMATPDTDFTAGVLPPTVWNSLPARPRWIWSDSGAAEKAKPETVYFRKVINLNEAPTNAVAVVACDSSYTLYVNGQKARTGTNYAKPNFAFIQPSLKAGPNVIAITAVSGAAREKFNADHPAGLLFYARISTTRMVHGNVVENHLDVLSDATWSWSAKREDGWDKNPVAAPAWPRAIDLGGANMTPWNNEKAFANTVQTAASYGKSRASLAVADALLTGLGRPNREQVITTRASAATTLQALELTNGQTLAKILGEGSGLWATDSNATAREIVQRIYKKSLGRTPTPQESRLAEAALGAPATRAGIEDVLWAVTMLPEFQLIH
jgi:mono/diheme cytochrome c family protein